jgi:hypothetical protein
MLLLLLVIAGVAVGALVGYLNYHFSVPVAAFVATSGVVGDVTIGEARLPYWQVFGSRHLHLNLRRKNAPSFGSTYRTCPTFSIAAC